MTKIKILIADSGYLSRQGLSALLLENEAWNLVGEAESSESLFEKVRLYRPDMIIIDYSTAAFRVEDLTQLSRKYPNTRILAITPELNKARITQAFDSGALSHLLKDCDKEEIIEAIIQTAKGQKFVCGKIVDCLISNDKEGGSMPRTTSCEGLSITTREMEIIRLIAEGYSNREVAQKLFLSTHTVTTHRKNIMNKLGVNNTAGLVLFAVKENLLNPNKFLFS